MRDFLAVTLAIVLSSGCAAAKGANRVQNLCDVLRTVDAGEHVAATVSGTYGEGPETRVLYANDCGPNVQPATWIELSAPTDETNRLREALKEFGDAEVVFRGTLYGPRLLSTTDTTPVPEMSQISARRYGHLSQFRTMFVVSEVVSFKGVTTAAGPRLFETPVESRVIQAGVPFYPASARLADVSGDVELEITITDGRVASVHTRRGHALLARAARENVRTWQFATGVSMTLTTVFQYRLEDAGVSRSATPRVELELPRRVTIIESRTKW